MDYGWMLLRMVVVLAAVCGLAWVLLRWGLKRLSPADPGASGRLEVVERLPVGADQSLMVVRTGDQYWLIGVSNAGIDRLGQLDPSAWRDSTTEDSAPGPN